VFDAFYLYRAPTASEDGQLTTRFYPAFIDVTDRPCVVVGGGPVATEKTEKLVECGARITLVSPLITDDLAAMVADGRIARHHRRVYRTGDLDGAFMVIAATDDESANRRVWADAEERRMLANVVDVPELCNFIVPSIMRHGELAVAVSTGGASPVVARRVRQTVELAIGPEWGELVGMLRETREDLKARYTDMPSRADAVERLLDAGIVERLAEGDRRGAAELLAACLEDRIEVTT